MQNNLAIFLFTQKTTMHKLITPLAFFAFSFSACNNQQETSTTSMTDSTAIHQVKTEPVSYQADSVTFQSFVAYDSADSAKRPVVMVLPEWWGLTEYPKMRAQQLADLGYFAMAVDLYGDGKIAEDP
ncbi:MAG: dienelactone hydrolase family protein, partial [Ferruginibacter sp.]